MQAKKILIICQYSQQPPYNTMLRYHNLGKCLVKKGYFVDILTSSRVHNTDYNLISLLGNNCSIVDGVNYYYVATPSYHGNGIKRMLNMYLFCHSIKKFKKKYSPDCIIVCGAYLYAYARRAFKSVPIITDIVDLWPQSIVEYTNTSIHNPFIKHLYRIEKEAYIKTDALVFSMEGGIDYVKEQKYCSKVDFSKVFHINMGIDLTLHDKNLLSHNDSLPWLPDNFNIGYCGSIRRANNIKQICDAALELQKRGYKDIQFQIYGNGDELESLQKYCQDNSICNIHFYGRIEKNKIPYILSRMKANILTYKQVDLMKYGGSQSKLFDYLAAGRPIICNAHFGYNLITRYDCGLITQSQNSNAFVDTIEELYSMDSSRIEQMGKNARMTAKLYDLPLLVNKLETVLQFVENKKPPKERN